MERQKVLMRLKKVLECYEDKGRITNDHYLKVKSKYEYILNGGQYQIVDKTKELKVAIAYVGGQIPTLNYKTNGVLINKPGITWEQAEERVKLFK